MYWSYIFTGHIKEINGHHKTLDFTTIKRKYQQEMFSECNIFTTYKMYRATKLKRTSLLIHRHTIAMNNYAHSRSSWRVLVEYRIHEQYQSVYPAMNSKRLISSIIL